MRVHNTNPPAAFDKHRGYADIDGLDNFENAKS
jgi:hypothetical protein